MTPKYPLKPGGFTIEGYNDRAKSCLKKGCKGMVHPTRSANHGKCDTCGKVFTWAKFRQLGK